MPKYKLRTDPKPPIMTPAVCSLQHTQLEKEKFRHDIIVDQKTTHN